MKDRTGRVIYVGKAANIKKRVFSYFARAQTTYKNEVLLKQVFDIETTITASEHEAFLLESRLIKEFKPRYNISLKDDKSFPFIKITKQDHPRIFIGRKKPDENIQYIGPYTNTKLLRLALKSLRKVFGFCRCYRFPKKECLDFHIGLCPGPCVNKVSKKDYKKNIQDFKHFLKKGRVSLIKELTKRMKRYATDKKFEEALKLREKIRALSLISKQSRVSSWDVLGLEKEPRRIEAFDISNIYGSESVGSMVTFLDGKPYKNNYRRFKIRMVKGIDDYKMLREVLSRRYSRLNRENMRKPDLIVIDGGRGHLNAACQQLNNLGLGLSIIAIAKDQELIYTVSKNQPIKLDREDRVLQLIQHVRDESHRFAIKYHKLLRKKKVFEKDK